MKTISDYTIRCTEQQTRKALELGAPIELEQTFRYNRNESKIEPHQDIDQDIEIDNNIIGMRIIDNLIQI